MTTVLLLVLFGALVWEVRWFLRYPA